MQNIEVRVDLHVHSENSDKPYSWFLRSGKSAECYTTPAQVYQTAMARGMNLVTICDHDTIAAAGELLACGPNTFISEEVSARFPEDGNIMHMIVLDITEAQHVELQRLRPNIYELVQYVEQQGIVNFLCHPLSEVNRRLKAEHLEKCLLMYRNLELRNGTRDQQHEDALLRITAGLTPEKLARWAEKYPEVPWINREAQYGFTGGSDDHGRVGIASAWTSFVGQPTAADLKLALAQRRTLPQGRNGGARTLGHNAFGVAAGYFKSDGVTNVVSAVQASGSGDGSVLRPTVQKHLTQPDADGKKFSWDELWQKGNTDEYNEWLHGKLSHMLIDIHRTALAKASSSVGQLDLVKLTGVIPDLLRGVLLGLPYLLTSRYTAKDRASAERHAAALGFPRSEDGPPRVVVFTDSIDHTDGVSLGLRRLAAQARAQGLDLRLAGISQDPEATRVVTDADGIVRLPTIFRHRLAEYHSLEFGIPHLESVMDYLVNERITLVQCSTPGPVGVMGMLAARICGLTTVGQYHTEVPEYAARLTGDTVVGDMMRAVTSWFYRQMDQVLVPSDAVARRVIEYGVEPERVRKVPRGIDLDLFRPQHRQEHAYEEFGLNGDPKVLYVGRISREKGLDSLIEGWKGVEHDEAKLVLVGDGPHRTTLAEKAPPGGSVVFTGEQHGEKLATLYASADIFVFPSETETFGNAVVEAQAAGLPVIVANKGAAAETVLDGVTGFVVDASDPEQLRAAIHRLLADDDLRERMGRAAAEWAKRFALPEAARGTFRIYQSALGDREPRSAGHH